MAISLIGSLIEDINAKVKMDLSKAFKTLLENEFIIVYNRCIELYNSELATAFADD